MENKIVWQPELRRSWENYSEDILTEKAQCREEGLDIAAYEPLFDAIAALPKGAVREQAADAAFAAVMQAEKLPDYPYEEPNDLEEIQAACSGEVPQGEVPSPETLKSRVAGAWYGRIAGCLLGKPIEGMYTEQFAPILTNGDNLPMHRYMRSTDITDELDEKYSLRWRWWADTQTAAPVDDDTNYTALYQLLIDTKGRDFTPRDVAEHWLQNQGKNAYCTAEKVAFRNFVDGYYPPYSAVYKNPYREWIGAQIRGDYFGYINPGDPAAAAGMAWRDGCISHVKNGIYGEMFVAAMLACAAVTQDIEAIILGGLAQIPPRSRLHEQVTRTVEKWRQGCPPEDFWRELHQRWDEHNIHHWCHTVSNAVIVTAALLYGGGDYGKSICMAVEQGFDTDCNGATVGSVLGMAFGLDAISEEWLAPLHGMLKTSILDIGTVAIDALVDKTLQHIAEKQ